MARPSRTWKEQVRLAFRNLNAVLAAAGCSFDDVVDVTVFIVDPHRSSNGSGASFPSSGDRRRIPRDRRGRYLAGFDFELKVIARLPDGAAG